MEREANPSRRRFLKVGTGAAAALLAAAGLGGRARAPASPDMVIGSDYILLKGLVADPTPVPDGGAWLRYDLGRLRFSPDGVLLKSLAHTDELGGAGHNLLSATHPDTLPASPVRGDLLLANATPAWARLAHPGLTNRVPKSSALDVAWGQVDFSELLGSLTTAQHGALAGPASAHRHSDLASIGANDHHVQLHQAAHNAAAGDALKLDDLAIPDDNTDLDSLTTRHGLLPKLGGGTTNFLRADGTWAAPAGGSGLSVTLISGASGAANTAAAPSETWQLLTANATATDTVLVTMMTTTGLPIGTYYFEYTVVWQSVLATAGIRFVVDYTGTVTRVRTTRKYPTTGAAAATGVADQVAATLTGQLVEHMSTRSDAGNLGPNTGVDTINADVMEKICGIIVVSTSANLLLQAASETTDDVSVRADTWLRLVRLA